MEVLHRDGLLQLLRPTAHSEEPAGELWLVREDLTPMWSCNKKRRRIPFYFIIIIQLIVFIICICVVGSRRRQPQLNVTTALLHVIALVQNSVTLIL